MALSPVSPVINRGILSNWLQSLPASTGMLTVDTSGNVSHQSIPVASFAALTGVPGDNAALASALAGKSNTGHTHSISDVSGLQTALDGKASLSGATFTGGISAAGLTNTPIGASNPSTGAFTSLSSTADGYFNSVRVGRGNNYIATNTAVGASCLTSITAGAFATAIGNLALSSLTTGNHNSAFGYSSNRYCTTASNNTSFGSNSLSLNVTGSNNTAIGSTALQLSTAGNNTAIGAGALASNTTGTNNVGVGTSSGRTNSTGSFNVNIGHATLFSSDGGSNNIAIGYTAGSYETSANKKLYIDSINRMTLEGGIAGSLIYGTFDATPANQTLHLNASTYWHNLYTNSTDWERLAIKWSSNVAIIATEAGGTGTVRNLAITGGNVGIGTTSPSAKLDVAGGTVTTSTPVLNVTQTWNASLVPFTGILANVTDTASASGSLLLDLQVGGSSKFSIAKSGVATFSGNVTVSAVNVITDTTTGTKIGTGTTQKLGFWNATPIVQPDTTGAAATTVAGSGTAVTEDSTFDGYTLAKIVKALRNTGILA